MAFVISVFLLLEVTRLKHNYNLLVLEKQSQSLEVRQVTQNLETLRQDLDGVGVDLNELASYVTEISTNLPNELRTEFKKNFMANPSLVAKAPSYAQQKNENGVVKVTGYRQQIREWMQENEFFLDQVVRKSLVLEWSAVRNQVVVADVIEGSIFHQMGLNKGDVILNVSGKMLTRGEDIRASLIELRPKKVALQRGEQRLTLDVGYEETTDVEQVAGDFTN